MIAGRDGDGVVLLTRNGNDLTAAFPDIAEAVGACRTARVLIDGEVVVHDDAGKPSFQRLQKRARLRREPDVRRAALELPATLYVFDLLAYDEFDVRAAAAPGAPRLLRRILPSAGVLRYSEHVEERGTDFFRAAESLGLEGIIASVPTRRTAPAGPPTGSRSARPHRRLRRHRPEGVEERRPARSARCTSPRTTRPLVYAGSVGTGLTPKHVQEVHRRRRRCAARCTRPRARRRRATTTWLEPTVVVEVRYLEWTEAGQLRHPVFLRVRDDKRPPNASGAAPSRRLAPDHWRNRRRRMTRRRPPERRRQDPPRRRSGIPAAARRQRRRDAQSASPTSTRCCGRTTATPRAISSSTIAHRAVDAAVPARPAGRADALPRRHPRQVVLPEGRAEWAPQWLRTETVHSEGSERDLRYFICDNVESLLYLANREPSRCTSGRAASPTRPAGLVQPRPGPEGCAVRARRRWRRRCTRCATEIGLPNYVKTSGSSGLHVLIPWAASARTSTRAARRAARAPHRAELPDIATIARVIEQREGRVYVDYLQNGHGKLLVAPFCVRPLPAAPVSMPLRWSDVNARLDIRRHTLRNAVKRLEKKGDPLLPVLTEVPDLLASLERLTAMEEKG
jgi:bifunctional non-homologous end joining protein LigD